MFKERKKNALLSADLEKAMAVVEYIAMMADVDLGYAEAEDIIIADGESADETVENAEDISVAETPETFDSKVEKYFDKGLWDEKWLSNAFSKGKIKKDKYDKILKKQGKEEAKEEAKAEKEESKSDKGKDKDKTKDKENAHDSETN